MTQERAKYSTGTRNGRRNGYGMNLYRNTQRRVLGGVCSGIADHFEIDPIVIRILFVFGFIALAGPLLFWFYIIAWIMLSPKPRNNMETGNEEYAYEYDESERCYRRKKMFRYSESPSVRIQKAKQRLNDVVNRVEEMENYVTSNRYRLDKEFADLEK